MTENKDNERKFGDKAIERVRMVSDYAKKMGYCKGESSFERYCGLSRRYINNSIRTENDGNVSTGIVCRIVDRIPEISVKWLVTGKGTMLCTDADDKVERSVEALRFKKLYENAMEQIGTLMELLNEK